MIWSLKYFTKRKTKEPKFVWKSGRRKYFIHIAIIDSGQQSVFSNASVLNVKCQTSNSKTPLRLRSLSGAPPSQEFSWKEVPFSEKYDMRFIKRANQNLLIRQSLNNTSFNFAALKRKLLLAVRAIDDLGNVGS